MSTFNIIIGICQVVYPLVTALLFHIHHKRMNATNDRIDTAFDCITERRKAHDCINERIDSVTKYLRIQK